MTPDQFIAECREWVGTPFLHRGRVKGKGVDCIGLPYMVTKDHNMFDMRTVPVDYARDPDGIELNKWLRENMQQIHNKKAQPGDIMLFRFVRHPQHVAVFTGSTIIHAYSKIGKCVEHRFDDRWKKRLVAVYRFREFAQ